MCCWHQSNFFHQINLTPATNLRSAVSCAMMLDLIQTLGEMLKGQQQQQQSPWGIQFIFFDGEEAFRSWSSTDSLYGSRKLAATWGQDVIDRIDLFVLLDLIGGRAPTFRDFFPGNPLEPFFFSSSLFV